jgi:hypothetical protein
MSLALVTAALVALSACGGASDDSGGVASANGGGSASARASASPSADDREQGLKFAQCMRTNGVPEFPDPDPKGGFSGMADKFDEPAVEKALEACRAQLPGGRRAAGDPQTQENLRKLAQCLRDLGYDVPDPDPNDPGAMMDGAAIDRTDPKVREDLKTCQDKLGLHFGGDQ